jgi:hypothetical protein
MQVGRWALHSEPVYAVVVIIWVDLIHADLQCV